MIVVCILGTSQFILWDILKKVIGAKSKCPSMTSVKSKRRVTLRAYAIQQLKGALRIYVLLLLFK